MTLRAAHPDDAPTIAAIWHQGWQDGHLGLVPDALTAVRTAESFRVRAPQRIDDTTVLTVDGAVAGFVMVVGDEVEQVYVSAAHRGSGTADALLAEAERIVRVHGFTSAWLAVVPGNERARAFYERRGWSDEGRFAYDAAVDGGTIAVPCHRYTKVVADPSDTT